MASALVEYEGALVDFMFNGASAYGTSDRTLIVGTNGTLESKGVDLNQQTVTLSTAEGVCQPALEGSWFPEGFQGTMAELLCAVEENREPSNSARNNLRSLALAFAGSLVSLYYYLAVLRQIFAEEPPGEIPEAQLDRLQRLTLAALAGGVLVLGVIPNGLVALIKNALL